MTRAIKGRMTLEPRGPAGAFILSDEQVALIGEGKRSFPVTVRVHGRDVALRLSRMGEENMIGLSKAKRAEAGIEIGESVAVEIWRDTAERVVEVPPELAAALAGDPIAAAAFERLPYSHRKEHARAVAEAKREETRARRVAAVIEQLTN